MWNLASPSCRSPIPRNYLVRFLAATPLAKGLRENLAPQLHWQKPTQEFGAPSPPAKGLRKAKGLRISCCDPRGTGVGDPHLAATTLLQEGGSGTAAGSSLLCCHLRGTDGSKSPKISGQSLLAYAKERLPSQLRSRCWCCANSIYQSLNFCSSCQANVVN